LPNHTKQHFFPIKLYCIEKICQWQWILLNLGANQNMKTQIRKTRTPIIVGLTILAVLMVGCHSSSDDIATATQTEDQIEDFDFDLDEVETQIGEAREPDPSLGFALPPNGRIYARSGTVGAALGSEFELSCATGQVLAGLSGNFSNRLERVQPLCVTADDTGTWIDAPTVLQNAIGSNNAQSFTRECPTGHAIIGFTSDFANNYPAYLQVHCRALDGALTTTGNRVTLAAVGNLGNNAPSTRPQCADRAAATGLFGYAQSAVERLGLVCYEDPAFAGRWSSRMDWPHIAIHSVMLSDGKLLTYGTGGSGIQGAMEFNVWDPALGIAQSSHKNIQGTAQVDSFCSAATMLSDTGDVLISGGDARPLGRNNSGIRDATLYGAASQSVSPANDMNYERWYPTSTTLPNGDILVAAGRDGNNVLADIPEVYSAKTGTWRTLDNASMSAYQYFYPRQFVIPDGRVFGVSSRSMYIMSTDGAGSITDVGQLPGHSFGTSATAAMYEPGKIIHAGGISGNGIGAVLIDTTSGTPVVTRTEDLAQPRRAWASTVLLADGKVMMVGGSYEINDEVTASLGTEMWDPATQKWTQYSRHELARLYHSTAILLMDGRVLLAGGGSPGPLNNRNGEIFSPPYLFDKNGALADRPEISYAPDKASWGQTVNIRTNNNSDIQRVTLVKTGSITHGFNMDQRFLELDFVAGANSLSVTMPESGNVAPLGHYLLFVHNANGTMLNLGGAAAPVTPPPNPGPQLPPIQANSLLINGDFEQGKQAWLDCAGSPNTSSAATNADGSASMKVTAGGCLYQEVNVQPGENYSMSCRARGNALEYSSVSLQMLDSNYGETVGKNVVIGSAEFEQQSASIIAPANAVYASVTLYSEGTAHFDRCELVLDSAPTTTTPPTTVPPTTPTPTTPTVSQAGSLINNGDFELGKADWNDCSLPGLTSATSDSANGSKSLATNYTSLTLTLMDENYTTLASDHKPVGRNIFQSYQTQLFTPFEGRIGAVTLPAWRCQFPGYSWLPGHSKYQTSQHRVDLAQTALR